MTQSLWLFPRLSGERSGSARRTVSEFGVESSDQSERFSLGVYKGSRLFQLLLSKHAVHRAV